MQEERVNGWQIHQNPGGTAVIALVGAFGSFHLTQQGIHFGETQAMAATNGGMAGAGAEQAFLACYQVGLGGCVLQGVQ